MSNINKQALREAADSVIQKYGSEWFETGRQLCTVHKSKIEFIAAANPAAVLVLLDELEAAEKQRESWRILAKQNISEREKDISTLAEVRQRIAELSHHLKCAHDFIEHTEAFGHEPTNGILCCGDAQWDIDASKSTLVAAGIITKVGGVGI